LNASAFVELNTAVVLATDSAEEPLVIFSSPERG
jgi:hypothetical protein